MLKENKNLKIDIKSSIDDIKKLEGKNHEATKELINCKTNYEMTLKNQELLTKSFKDENNLLKDKCTAVFDLLENNSKKSNDSKAQI